MNDRAATAHAMPLKRSPSDLAHESDFRLGRTQVRPSILQVRRAAKAAQPLEPRVMQVLVVLARADGDVVSRSELIERCWDGRVVGDNAINRVISRLRQLAAGTCCGDFAIETIPRVGYRLKPGHAVAADGDEPLPLGNATQESPSRAMASAAPGPHAAQLPARRHWLKAALAAAVAGGLGGAAWLAWQRPGSGSRGGARARREPDRRRRAAARR